MIFIYVGLVEGTASCFDLYNFTVRWHPHHELLNGIRAILGLRKLQWVSLVDAILPCLYGSVGATFFFCEQQDGI